ncbi:MAG: hypothetical protein QMD82_04460 [bacterium]|nr:hypothetical protein [bacterium]
MRLLLLIVTSLTNLYTGVPYGDQLDLRGLPFLDSFGKYYVSFTFNSALVNEYRYQYLYDSYNNTVGRQITYERNNYYLLKPSLSLGYAFLGVKTYLYLRGVADLNYLYEKIQYNSSYLVEDTIREERKGDIFEGGFAVSLNIAGFNVATGIGLINKNSPTLIQRSVRALGAAGYSSKSFGVLVQLLTKVKFPDENFYSLPNQLVFSGYYNPAVKSGAKIHFDLLYKRFSKINAALKDYWVGSLEISHAFRDMAFLKVGGLLEKSFVDDTYIPGIDFALGYKMSPFYFELSVCKTFISYSQGSELIEENPLKIRFDIKIAD